MSYITENNRTALNCAVAAKKAKLHAVIQSAGMLFSVVESVINELRASNIGALSEPLVIAPERLLTKDQVRSGNFVPSGRHPCGRVSDTIILYVTAGSFLTQVSRLKLYVEHDLLPRLTRGGSLIVLADTSPNANQASDAIAELLPGVIRVRTGCAGVQVSSLEREMRSLGAAWFNQFFGVPASARLSAAEEVVAHSKPQLLKQLRALGDQLCNADERLFEAMLPTWHKLLEQYGKAQ